MFITEETLSCSKAGQVSHLPCYVCSRAVNPRVQSSGVHVAERGRKLFPCRVEVGEACCVNDWRGVKMTRAIGECPHGISCRAHSSQASCTQWPAPAYVHLVVAANPCAVASRGFHCRRVILILARLRSYTCCPVDTSAHVATPRGSHVLDDREIYRDGLVA